MLTQFILVRHGEPEDSHCLLGRTNPPLTAKGVQQLKQVCMNINIDQIVSSPLKRCADFSLWFSQQKQCPLLVDDRLQEMNFGCWDGLSLSHLWQLPSGEFERFWQQPWQFSPPEGETTQQVLARVAQLLIELARRHPGEKLLLFTHSGVMRIVLCWLLNSKEQGNAHLSRVELNYGAQITMSLYQDDEGQLWPQMLGFTNSHY
jgi:alpha-ribazole phosphatase